MDNPLIVSIVGARPNFIKLAAFSPELRKVAREVIIHTGQHYDYEMSKIFFEEMCIPTPNYHLNVGSGSHGIQTGEMLIRTENILAEIQPDAVVVYGDTNSTLAGALAAAKLHIPIAHIEAGLRSYDKKMPEEINRIIVDNISDMLFCPTSRAYTNIVHGQEYSSSLKFMEGDVMVDLMGGEIKNNRLGDYYLLTIHREENDNPAKLKGIFEGLSKIKDTIIFPWHPRIRRNLSMIDIPENVQFVDPVGYSTMRSLEANAKKIITDSGGIQKEAYLLKVPCITLRESTEWLETLYGGWNMLVGSNPLKIQVALDIIPDGRMHHPDQFGKPGVSKRIANTIVGWL